MDASTPTEELMRKIEELEAGPAHHSKQEMSRLKLSNTETTSPENSSSNNTHHHHYHHHHQRSHSVSPQRPRLGATVSRRRGGGGGAGLEATTIVWKSSNSASFRDSSRLQRETRGGDGNSGTRSGGGNRGPSAVLLLIGST